MPASICEIWRAEPAATLRRPSCVTPPVWKALATLGCCSSRDVGEGGSTRHTSSPAPARWPLSSAASSAFVVDAAARR